jgi:hypothetical protein
MSRSERKRHREKKRRSDVNRGFEDLLALLVEVDAGVRHEVGVERVRRAQARGEAVVPGNSGSGAPASLPSSSAVQGDDSSLLSRVDLIDRATSVLKRVHRENEQRKLLIETLVLQGQGQQLQATTRSQIPFSFLSDSPELVRRGLYLVVSSFRTLSASLTDLLRVIFFLSSCVSRHPGLEA